MDDFTTQGLAYILNISNGVAPEAITAESTERDVAEMLGYALQVLDINTSEFESFASAIATERFCSLDTLKLVYTVANCFVEGKLSETKELLPRLIAEEVPGIAFKKYINTLCVNTILRLNLLGEYKDYVNKALELIKDQSVAVISFYTRNT